MTEEKHSYQEIVAPKSQGESSFPLFNQLKILPALSVVIIFASVAIKYLTELDLIVGLSCPLSWRNSTLLWCCFFLYSLGLVFISLHISQRLYTKSVTSDPPNAITRLRSHLTFLPLSHFIRQHVVASEYITRNPFNGQLSSVSPHTNGNDKEYLSRLEFQRDALIDAILEGCVFPWYEKISDEKTFPTQSKQILQASFHRLAIKFRQMDRTKLVKEVIEIVHSHWNNYCDAAKKVSSTEDDLVQNFKYAHDCVKTREEVTKHYETLSCILLKELIVPDLQSTIVCQFLAGILVKGFILYYVDLISDPKWINATLKKIISAENANSSGADIPLTNGSSQESICDSTCKGKDDDADHKIRLTDFTEDSNESKRILAESDLPVGPRRTINAESLDCQCEAHEDNPSSSIFAVKIKPEFEYKNKKSTSVSAALEGLLSATALPLLPEGSSYDLKRLDNSEPGDSTTENEVDTINKESYNDNSSSKEAGYSVGTQPLEDDQPFVTERVNANEAPVVKPVLSPINRHHSLDDSGKTKTLGGDKVTRSLDEAQENCTVTRQEEFDLCMDDQPKRRSENDYDNQDVSPLYDEPEDFAATIAKLRSLLEQRESQKNLIDPVSMPLESEGGSAGEATTSEMANGMEATGAAEMESEVFSQSRSSPEKNSPESNNSSQSTQSQPIKNSFDNIRPSLNSQSSASSLGSDASVGSSVSHCSWDTEKLEKIVDELEEAGPVVNRFFLNVAIPKTETCSDSSGNFVLYCIQYEGVYLEENDDGQLEKLVLRTTTIKRRFQEFTMLQNCLEESNLWKPHIKGIKAPNKWLNLSFSKSDNTTLNQRKLILERYLQQLCYHPVLGFCPHLRQFMAYGEEGFQAFTTSDAIPLHRFDKLAKKFTGVFNSLREALPSFESDLLAAPGSPDATGKSPTTESKARSLFASFLRAESKCPLSEKLEGGAVKASDETDSISNIADSNWKIKADNEDSNLRSEAELSFDLNLGEPISSTSETLLEEPLSEAVMDAVYPLAVAMTQLLCDVLWLPRHRPHSASVSAFLSISGKSFENYIQDSLDLFLSQDSVLGYLETITAAIKEWSALDEPAVFEQYAELVSEEELKNCLKEKIPVWVRWMWGRSRVDATIERLTKVCQNTILNQDIILSLIELLFSKLIEAVELEVTDGFK